MRTEVFPLKFTHTGKVQKREGILSSAGEMVPSSQQIIKMTFVTSVLEDLQKANINDFRKAEI
jgi:hypothetical protein